VTRFPQVPTAAPLHQREYLAAAARSTALLAVVVKRRLILIVAVFPPLLREPDEQYTGE